MLAPTTGAQPTVNVMVQIATKKENQAFGMATNHDHDDATDATEDHDDQWQEPAQSLGGNHDDNDHEY